MAVDLQGLARILEASLDPTQNKQGWLRTILRQVTCTNSDTTAELAIVQEEQKPNFSLSLLQIVSTEAYGGTARLASALYFKNYVKRHWIVCTSAMSFKRATRPTNEPFRMRKETTCYLRTRSAPSSKNSLAS